MVAIAIPTFSGAVDRAREATEVANARSFCAEGMMYIVSGGEYTNGKVIDELTKTINGSTYKFIYLNTTTNEEGTKGSWRIEITGDDAINKVYSNAKDKVSFSNVKIDGKPDSTTTT